MARRDDGAVELAFGIVRTAHHGADGALGIGDHHGALLDPILLALLTDDRGDGLFGIGLKRGVDRGADNKVIARRVRALDDRLGLLKGPVEEVVRRVYVVAAIDGSSGVAARSRHLALRKEAGCDQIGKHQIGAATGGGQVDMGGVIARRLEHAGEHGGFGKVDILHALAEVEFGGGGNAIIAPAHIGAVEIELEDLIL